MRIRSRTLLIGFCLLAIGISAHGQYWVLQVSGEIYFQKRDRFLKQGDKLVPTDILKFEDPNAVAAVMGTDKVRYDIKGSQEAVDGAWEVPVSASLTDVKQRLSMGLAIGFKQTKLFDVISADRYVVLPPGKVSINTTEHPMDKSHRFLMKVTSADTNFIVILPSEGSQLILDPAKVFGDYIPAPNSVIELIYERGSNRETLGETGIRFVEPDQLEKDMTILLELMGADGQEKEEVFNVVFQMFEAVYGAPDEWNLNAWLSKNFKLK